MEVYQLPFHVPIWQYLFSIIVLGRSFSLFPIDRPIKTLPPLNTDLSTVQVDA